MKRLYLLRHALAMPSSAAGDKGRKLAPQGLADAEALGKAMQRKGYKPALVLCSPALRTSETWAQASLALGAIETRKPDSLYNAGRDVFLEELEGLDDSVESVLIVAHNPGIHDFAARLASEESPASFLTRLMEGFRPATLAVLDCPIESWLDLADEQNRLIDLQDPMDYNAPSSPARWT